MPIWTPCECMLGKHTNMIQHGSCFEEQHKKAEEYQENIERDWKQCQSTIPHFTNLHSFVTCLLCNDKADS
jgi:hypothetical protein